MTSQTLRAASFRDPAGYMFRGKDGRLYRGITQVGAADYRLLVSSGLYSHLSEKEWLVKHVEKGPKEKDPTFEVTIKPDEIPHISYPFEWSFTQLKDAALLTLKIQKAARKHGMTLKDASAYNVQFVNGKPIFIDTLSFEESTPGKPLQAYRQFCEHFLAPLALMSKVDASLLQLLRTHIDGVPLELASKVLPPSSRLRAGLFMHVYLHARAQKAKATDYKQAKKQVSVSEQSQAAIVESLERTVKSLKLRKDATEWGDYYNITNYTVNAADAKAKLVSSFVKQCKPKTVLDFGGNNGKFSRVVNGAGVATVCADIDPNAVEANYLYVKSNKETQMLPLLVDMTNPGGKLGWANEERQAVHERLQCDAVMALALIHHLAISNNLPFGHIAEYLTKFAPYLIIEFVPKEDSQVQKLLASRKDIFPNYNREGFKKAFSEYYKVVEEKPIRGTKRTLYLLKRK